MIQLGLERPASNSEFLFSYFFLRFMTSSMSIDQNLCNIPTQIQVECDNMY